MSGLVQVDVTMWNDVLQLDATEWLWLDMAEGGLHRGALPAKRPSQLSHAWGWSEDRLLRLRFDQDLPGGVVGAEIAVADAGTPREVIIWHNRSGKIQMLHSDFHADDGRARVQLEEFVFHVESRDKRGVVRMPVSFYRVVDR